MEDQGSMPVRGTDFSLIHKFDSGSGSHTSIIGRSKRQGSLRKRPATDRLLGLRVRIPPGYECVSYECCVLPGRGPSQGPITHPEESYRLWYVIVCDLETSTTRRPWPALGSCAREKKIYYVDILPLFLAISCRSVKMTNNPHVRLS
jgi:hypothetical protein